MTKKRNSKYSEGFKGITNDGDCFTLVNKESHKECYILFDGFEDYGEVKTTAKNIARGSILNPFKRNVYGKGYLGVLKSSCRNERSYTIWSGMIRRCYSEEYVCRFWRDCSVSEKWLCYSNFKEWYDTNSLYHKDCLDKDILFKGNRLYSPETCCLVPNELNVLLTNRRNHRGDYLIGVTPRKGKFLSRCSVKGEHITIGTYSTELEAFLSYKDYKENYIKSLAEDYLNKGYINHRVYLALLNYKIDIED